MKETKEESPLMKKLSDILANKKEFYGFDSDEIEIEYCPKCGRKL